MRRNKQESAGESSWVTISKWEPATPMRAKRTSALPKPSGQKKSPKTVLAKVSERGILKAKPPAMSTATMAKVDGMVTRLLADLKQIIVQEFRKRGAAQVQAISRRMLVSG